MLCKTMSLMFLVVTILVLTTVDGCGPPPNPCGPLYCRFPQCDEFYRATCIPAANSSQCNGWVNECRCDHDRDPVCCHARQCRPVDAMENPALLGAENFEFTDFPTSVQPAAFGSSTPGIGVPAIKGVISGKIKINFPDPFLLESVTVTTFPASVSSFRLQVWYTGGNHDTVVAYGSYYTLPANTVVNAIRISDIEVAGGGDLVVNLQLSVMGCLDPACEEAGGFCLERLPKNNGGCIVPVRDENGVYQGYVDGRWYGGKGFACNGKSNHIRCCRPV